MLEVSEGLSCKCMLGAKEAESQGWPRIGQPPMAHPSDLGHYWDKEPYAKVYGPLRVQSDTESDPLPAAASGLHPEHQTLGSCPHHPISNASPDSLSIASRAVPSG